MVDNRFDIWPGGGSDLWDSGPSGSLLTADFFGSSTSGYIKVWSGAAWVKHPIKYWNGSSWVQKPLKFWNGSSWVTTA